MDQLRQDIPEQEPLGIVISSGARGDAPSRVSAYVWSDVPEPAAESTARRAA